MSLLCGRLGRLLVPLRVSLTTALTLSTLMVMVAGVLKGQTPGPAVASLGNAIPVIGLASDQRGLALWNAGTGAPEPAMTGHSTPWTTCSTSAPYYLATRDHSTLDAASSEGFRAAPPISGLTGFTDALAANGFTTSELTVSLDRQSLGDDAEGADWVFDETTGVETRYYTGGELTVALGGEPLAGGPMPPTLITTTHNNLADCGDDAVALTTGVVVLENRASAGSAAVQAVATALVGDLAGNGLRLVVGTLQATSQNITDNSRTGVFLESASGRAEVAAPCSCDIGIHDADHAHDWTLVWPEAALPDNGPISLKLVAVTQAPSGGRVTLTVFDDNNPTQGSVLDVSFPANPGEAEATLELSIQPQTEYRFTVTRSSSAGSGRDYRVGASHSSLQLAQSDQRYLSGRSQDWGIEAGAGETVTLELATDAAANGLTMATSAFVTIVDPATDQVVDGPTNLAFSPGASQTVSFQNGEAARRLVAQVDPDGAFRMRRSDGDGKLYSLACPARTGLAFAPLSLIQTEIFDARCTRCHGALGRAGLDLRSPQSHGNLVNITSTEVSLLLVAPGDPEASYLVHKVDGRPGIVGSRMPQGGPFLTDAEIALVRGWIQGGAPNN